MKQMQRLNHISNLFTTEPALALARAMLAKGPWKFSSVFFGNSGTEANEAALKYARLYAMRTKGPGHEKLLCFSGAFHGRTLGSLSVHADARSTRTRTCRCFPAWSWRRSTTCRRCAHVLTSEFAGVIVEVIQGEGGLTGMTVGVRPGAERGLREGPRPS